MGKSTNGKFYDEESKTIEKKIQSQDKKSSKNQTKPNQIISSGKGNRAAKTNEKNTDVRRTGDSDCLIV